MQWSQTGNIVTATLNDEILFALYHEQPIADFLEFYRAHVIRCLASRRYDAECQGIIVPGIGPIATDRASQSMITSALAFSNFMAPGATITWKLTDGTFVDIDATGIQSIALAVATHIQACFANESSVLTQLHAAVTDEDVRAVDLTSIW